MKRRKKVISFLLTLALVLGLMPVSFGEPAKVLAIETPTGSTSGTCGDNLTWELTEDTGANWDLVQGKPYKLTIKGSGAMNDFLSIYNNENKTPWYSYCSMITSVSLPEGLTSIGSCAFGNCVSLKTITIPDSVTSIGNRAFSDCCLLETIIFGNNWRGCIFGL